MRRHRRLLLRIVVVLTIKVKIRALRKEERSRIAQAIRLLSWLDYPRQFSFLTIVWPAGPPPAAAHAGSAPSTRGRRHRTPPCTA
jgi:hypothetical protein